MKEKLIFGIDICTHGLRVALTGQLPSWEEIRSCVICLCCWRILDASLAGAPLCSHRYAQRIMLVMATQLVQDRSAASSQENRRFYAHLADCRSCAADFLCACIALEQPPEEQDRSTVEPRWRRIAEGSSGED